MNKKTIIASLNKIANELDTNGLYNEANTVTKVMSRLAMDENDEYNREDYFPYGDPDGDDDEYMDEDDNMDPQTFRNNMYEGFDEIANMHDPMGTSNKPDDLLRHHAEDYNDPKIYDLVGVFSELDSMILGNDMLTPEQKRRYREIKSKLMRS